MTGFFTASQDDVPVENRHSCLSSDRQDCLSSTSAISSEPLKMTGLFRSRQTTRKILRDAIESIKTIHESSARLNPEATDVV